MAEDLDDTIRENAAGPRKASGDSGSVEQHGLADQIAADKYLESKKASHSAGSKLRAVRSLIPTASQVYIHRLAQRTAKHLPRPGPPQ